MAARDPKTRNEDIFHAVFGSGRAKNSSYLGSPRRVTARHTVCRRMAIPDTHSTTENAVNLSASGCLTSLRAYQTCSWRTAADRRVPHRRLYLAASRRIKRALKTKCLWRIGHDGHPCHRLVDPRTEVTSTRLASRTIGISLDSTPYTTQW